MSADDDFSATLHRRLDDAAPLIDVDTSGVVATARRRRTWRATATGVLAAAVGVLAAAGLPPLWERTDVPSASASPTADAQRPQEYRYAGMVIGEDGAPPTLCSGVVLHSYPPQCSGAPALGWDWSDVPDLGQADAQLPGAAPGANNGVRWGWYEVIGTWDGRSLTLTRPVALADRGFTDPGVSPDFSTPCPRPAEGWVPVDSARTSSGAFDRGVAAAEDVEGFAAAWIDRNPGSARPTWVVLNVLTAGDVATTEAAVREHWGGALCVTGGASRSVAELDAVVADLMTDEPMPLGVGRDVFHGQVQLTVWVATPELQETYDDRYGPGVVELHSLLVPLA